MSFRCLRELLVLNLLVITAFAVPIAASAAADSKADKKPDDATAETKKDQSEDAADDSASDSTSGMDTSVAAVAERARKSVVVVSFSGRDGQQQGLGTGFVISPDGLIATNLHVIGEARPIEVTFADGRKFPVEAIHATEKSTDLAIIDIDADGLTPLELGDSDRAREQRRPASGHGRTRSRNRLVEVAGDPQPGICRRRQRAQAADREAESHPDVTLDDHRSTR